MRKILLIPACLLAVCGTWSGAAQTAASGSAQPAHVCECGAHPPAPPRDRAVEPYAGEPQDMSPYSKFATPYDLNYIRPNIYTGAGRDIPEPKNITEVRIGFFGPIEHSPDQKYGLRMLLGAQMAVDEWNARGGYGGKPFKLMLHNDYDNWQAKAVYGDDRSTDPTIWGSASNEAVKMIYDDEDWAIFGSLNSESTHIILRVALKAEIPIVNSESTDFTIPETYVPWYFTDIQDDRVQAFTLARRIYTELGLKRVAILRVNNRYGRFGVPKFRDASRRLGHPVVLEQKFVPGDTDFTAQLQAIRDMRTDAVVLWTDEDKAGLILKQMRAMGMKQRVFGSHRTLGSTLLAEAGDAAEGFEAVYPYDPSRNDPRWLQFNRDYEARNNEKADHYSALAYDAMNALLSSICKAGLNRARIHDALADIEQYDGVTGPMIFDPNQKNVEPMYLGTVHNGVITYRPESMEKKLAAPAAAAAQSPKAEPEGSAMQTPYAHVGEDGVGLAGPHGTNTQAGAARVILFGPGAAAIAQSAEMLAAIESNAGRGKLWNVLPIESKQNWGAASTELVRALIDEHAIAIVALDRDSAHLAVQLALKSFVPVVALSDDRTLTSSDIPWIFRLPAATSPVEAMRILVTAASGSGASPTQLRDTLASDKFILGVAFEPGGEPRSSASAARQ
jgi:ABC-type branched-subunit amino acid transport system substrate-binding protein